jgi:hypothetical protein
MNEESSRSEVSVSSNSSMSGMSDDENLVGPLVPLGAEADPLAATASVDQVDSPKPKKKTLTMAELFALKNPSIDAALNLGGDGGFVQDEVPTVDLRVRSDDEEEAEDHFNVEDSAGVTHSRNSMGVVEEPVPLGGGNSGTNDDEDELSDIKHTMVDVNMDVSVLFDTAVGDNGEPELHNNTFLESPDKGGVVEGGEAGGGGLNLADPMSSTNGSGSEELEGYSRVVGKNEHGARSPLPKTPLLRRALSDSSPGGGSSGVSPSPRIKNLTSLIREQAEQISSLEFTKMSMIEDLDRKSRELNEKMIEVEVKDKEVERLRKNLVEARSSMKTQIDSTSSSARDKSDRVEELESEIDRLNNQVSDLQHESTLSKNRHERLAADAAQVRTELRDAKVELNSNHLDLSEYKLSCESLKEENESLKDQIEGTIAAHKEHQVMFSKVKAELKGVESRLADADMAKAVAEAALEEKNDELTAVISRGTHALESAKAALSKKQQDFVALDSHYYKMELETEELRRRVEGADRENERLRAQLGMVPNARVTAAAASRQQPESHMQQMQRALARERQQEREEEEEEEEEVEVYTPAPAPEPAPAPAPAPVPVVKRKPHVSRTTFEGLPPPPRSRASMGGDDDGGNPAPAPFVATKAMSPAVARARAHMAEQQQLQFDSSDSPSETGTNSAGIAAAAANAPTKRALRPKPRVNLGDWKREGYASEYEYAQATGSLQLESSSSDEIIDVPATSSSTKKAVRTMSDIYAAKLAASEQQQEANPQQQQGSGGGGGGGGGGRSNLDLDGGLARKAAEARRAIASSNRQHHDIFGSEAAPPPPPPRAPTVSSAPEHQQHEEPRINSDNSSRRGSNDMAVRVQRSSHKLTESSVDVGHSPWATEASSSDLAATYDALERNLTSLITERTSLREEQERLHGRGGKTLKERTRGVQVEMRLGEVDKDIRETRKELLTRPQ